MEIDNSELFDKIKKSKEAKTIEMLRVHPDISEQDGNQMWKEMFKPGEIKLINELTEIFQYGSSEKQPLIIGLNNYDILKKKLNLNKSSWNKIIELTNKKQLNECIERVLKTLNRPRKYSKDIKQEIIENIIEPIIEKNILTKENNTKVLFSLIKLGFKEGIKFDNKVLGTLIDNSNDTMEGILEFPEKSEIHESVLDIIWTNHLSHISSITKYTKTDVKNDYIDFITEENLQKIINKTNNLTIVNKKELMVNYEKIKDTIRGNAFIPGLLGGNKYLYISNRNKIMNKIIKKDLEKLMIYVEAKGERIFKNSNTKIFYDTYINNQEEENKSMLGDKGVFDENIDDIVNRVSQSNEDSLTVLDYWINNRFIRDLKANKDDIELKDEHIELLVNAIDYKTAKQESNIAHLLLKKLDESNILVSKGTYELPFIQYEEKVNIPYFKKLLDKNKEIPGKNGFLIKYYLNEEFKKVVNITEEEFKSYIDIESANNPNVGFLNECINKNLSNYRRTQSLVSFAIDMINIETDTSKKIANKLLDEIEEAKYEGNNYELKSKISSENLIKLLTKENIDGEISKKLLFVIDKIEYIWNTKVSKEAIFNNIDFNKIDFTYERLKQNKGFKNIISNINKSYKAQFLPDLVEVEYINIWDEMLNYKNKKGEKIYSNENIKVLFDKIDFTRVKNRMGIVDSILGENQFFIKYFVKEDPIFFEKIINSIIDGSIKNKYFDTKEVDLRNLLNHTETGFLTDLTRRLLKLKEFVEFNDELILKCYRESDKEKIKKEEINKSGVAILMQEEDLNNIEVAYGLIKRKKENFYKLGKQLIEFLQLSIENGEQVLSTYSEDNTKGILNVFKRKEKEKLQNKINEAIIYAEKQQINVIDIKKEIGTINKGNLNKEEESKINEIIIKLEEITKEDLKELSITENADLKRCLENSYIKVIKNYVKLNSKDKTSEVMEDFNNIMDYCIKEIKDKTNTTKVNKKFKM